MLPALIVGVYTAWHLGLRAGVVAAAVTAAAMLLAVFVPIPGITLAIYAVVIAWCAAMHFLGGKIGEHAQAPGWLSELTGEAMNWARKLTKRR
jgi:hypothetical protein